MQPLAAPVKPEYDWQAVRRDIVGAPANDKLAMEVRRIDGGSRKGWIDRVGARQGWFAEQPRQREKRK
jgi:hypothetical protein